MLVITTKQELCKVIAEAIELVPNQFTVQKLTAGTANVQEAATKVVRLVKVYRKKASDNVAVDTFLKKYQSYILDNEVFYISSEATYNTTLESDLKSLYDNATKFIWKLNEDVNSLKKSYENYRITEASYNEISAKLSTMVSTVNEIFVNGVGFKVFGKDEKGTYMTRLILSKDWNGLVAGKVEA